jgi:adenine-specific DNA-methyltransferase
VAKRKKSGPKPVSSITHADERTNIPTGELAEFVADDERRPTWITYPRDPSVSPQLVWLGKDEQDAEDLAVAAPPIYIQEKLHPQVIIENLRRHPNQNVEQEELTLFDDFRDDLPFEDKVDFYAHQQGWTNRLILGDSLNVMASLAEKEQLRSKVQMIYIDPPYGIKFNSNWQVSTRSRDVLDGRDSDLIRQPEQVKAFRDTWRLGIHSYLAYLRDRLTVSRDMLTESGSVFVQIGDENVHLVRSLMDEIFGADNFVSLISYSKTAGATGDFLPGVVDYIVWYAKDRAQAKYRRLWQDKKFGGPGASKYDQVEHHDGTRSSMKSEQKSQKAPLPDGARAFRFDNLKSQSVGREKGEGAASWFPVRIGDAEYTPGSRSRWKTNEEGMKRLQAARRVAVTGSTISYVRYLDDFPAYALTNNWSDIGGIQSRTDPKVYVVQTATTAVQRCLLMATDPGDLVLDPTCGSGTTAVVAEQWGRRWIATDTSRVALALARTRLMSARFPYYLLADTPDGRQKERELTGFGASGSDSAATGGDVRKGFVYRRIPHVTLKSIAQNPDIREGMSREKIESAIVRHGESEVLYDQPYENKQRIRVTGPFTVESLSPHRLLSPDSEEPGSVVAAQQDPDQVDFVTVILDNLAKAGVKTTTKGEEIDFDRLEPYAGSYLHAEGSYADATGDTRRVAVAIGPEHGTVGQTLVREAAKEALKGYGFDVLVVCGFAFDAHAGEAAKEFAASNDDVRLAAEETRLGKLPVLLTRMNPDLSMGDTLLKKTGAGNLFMVFGEPDVVVKEEDDRLSVEILGVDVYDPTTGEVRSDSTDDLACWFIDTDYDGESFFVRHAYFTGADEPYERLKRALKADIDPEAWESLYSTVSRPFPKPSTGRIAVKVINHYGDEVLKVYDV